MLIKWELDKPDVGAEIYSIAHTHIDHYVVTIAKDIIRPRFVVITGHPVLRKRIPVIPYSRVVNSNILVEAHKRIERWLESEANNDISLDNDAV